MKQTRREFVRTLFVATQAAVVGSLIPGNLFAADAPPSVAAGGLRFLVFGDWGRNGEQDQTEVATQMARASKDISARFVISVGDNFYNEGVTSSTDPQWQTSFENVYHDPALQIPWQVILGNHDYYGNCDAQIEYSKTHPRWNMPARYFVQTHRIDDSATADFFYLDTTPMIKSYVHQAKIGPNIATQDTAKQLAWFENALASSKARWKIVFGHHPIYSGGKHSDTADLIEQVLPLLHKYNVQAWFNGHDHDLQHLADDKMNFFCSGAGSQVSLTQRIRQSKFLEACPGFIATILHPDQMEIRMIDNFGNLLYTATVPVEMAVPSAMT
ncbi:MAG TPA: tartrate-resistant acid phosphatase type 5 family protein [Verrucomicrobiae bacterium]|jgi:acid phosphatase